MYIVTVNKFITLKKPVSIIHAICLDENIAPNISTNMEVAGVPLFSFISLILTVVALIIDIVGFASPYWYYQKFAALNDVVYKAGLWKTCTPDCVNAENLKCKYIAN